MEEKTINFEKAFGRLEEILQIMNRGEVSLDDALKLYEEADTLIGLSSKRLAQAEQKIEQLIKKRDGTTESVPLDSKVMVDAR